MAITVTVTPGKQFAATELITIPKLNALGQPTFAITGTVATGDLAAAAVTPDKMTPGAYFYTGSVAFVNPTYTLTGYPATPVLADGLELWFKANADNVAAVTVDATGLAKKLFKNKTEDLTVGDIRTNQIVGMRYEATGDAGNGCWQMISHLGAASLYYDNAPTGTGDAVVLALGPAPVAYADLKGKLVVFKATAANTGAVSVQVNGLAGPPAVKKFNGTGLIANDISVGQMVLMFYDGTNWQTVTPMGTLLSSGQEFTIVGSTRGLFIKNNMSAGKLDLTADDVIVKTQAGISSLRSGIGFTIDISAGAVAANGFDAGWGGAAWYFIYVIYHPTPGVAGLLSLSATAPALPAAYTGGYYANVGQIYVPTGITLQQISQFGRRTFIRQNPVFGAGATGVGASYVQLSATYPGAWATFKTLVPPNARAFSGTLGSVTVARGMAVAGDISGLGASIQAGGVLAGTVAGFLSASRFECPLVTPQDFFFITQDGAVNEYRLDVSGYEI